MGPAEPDRPSGGVDRLRLCPGRCRRRLRFAVGALSGGPPPSAGVAVARWERELGVDPGNVGADPDRALADPRGAPGSVATVLDRRGHRRDRRHGADPIHGSVPVAGRPVGHAARDPRCCVGRHRRGDRPGLRGGDRGLGFDRGPRRRPTLAPRLGDHRRTGAGMVEYRRRRDDGHVRPPRVAPGLGGRDSGTGHPTDASALATLLPRGLARRRSRTAALGPEAGHQPDRCLVAAHRCAGRRLRQRRCRDRAAASRPAQRRERGRRSGGGCRGGRPDSSRSSSDASTGWCTATHGTRCRSSTGSPRA